MAQVPAKRASSEGNGGGKKKMVKLSLSPAPPAVEGPKVVKLGAPPPAIGVDNSPEALLDRSQRFNDSSNGTPAKKMVSLKTSTPPPPVYKKTELGIGGAKAGNIKGTSQELERAYMRLHWVPDPATVRPEPVLKKALSLVKEKWVSKPDYGHANDQLMSIQQDCKLQGITGGVACDAFETHIRIALERGNLGDFAKCLAPLCELYYLADQKGVGAKAWSANADEFLAYRLLHGMIEERDFVTTTSAAIAGLSPQQRRSEDISHAVDVAKSLVSGDHHTFFKLYVDAPKMGGFAMDFFVDRVRMVALNAYVGSMQPYIDLHDLKQWLHFNKRKECFRFLKDKGMKFSDDNKFLDTKASREARTPTLAAAPKRGAMPGVRKPHPTKLTLKR